MRSGPGQSDEYIAFGRPRDPTLTVGNHDPRFGGRGNFGDMKRDISFSDIRFLHEASGLPVIVKGIVDPEDIRQAIAAGAAAIWVAITAAGRWMAARARSPCCAAAWMRSKGACRSSSTAASGAASTSSRRCAMGATVCAVGRPVLWGLICGGAPGVKSVYD